MGFCHKEKQALRYWDEEEIEFRDWCIKAITLDIKKTLLDINPAWKFKRVEGPVLDTLDSVPEKSNFLRENSFITARGEKEYYLRPETTASSFFAAEHYLTGEHVRRARLPLCVYQSGKSFRTELNDGASPSKLRFLEFYQLEFQCLYSAGTKADYELKVTNSLINVIESLTNRTVMYEKSDRLPYYSESTMDIIVSDNDFYWPAMELASISMRNDYPDKNVRVLEFAIGLDRLICVRKSSDEF